MSGLLVVGIGNPDCGDDAVGPLVAGLLAGWAATGANISRDVAHSVMAHRIKSGGRGHQRLASLGRLPSGVAIQVRTGDMMGLIEDWTGRDVVVLVDAAAAVSEPGTIHRLDLLRDTLPVGLSLASTHAFGLADAVELARVLGQLPRSLIAYAIEGVAFEPGAPLSAAVAAAAEAVATRVAADLHKLAASLAEAGPHSCQARQPVGGTDPVE